MIAVIVDAQRPGSSSWTSVRKGCRKIRVQGLHGGEVILTLLSEELRKNLNVSRDQVIELDPAVERVMARIIRVTEESRINIDLER